MYPLYCGLRLRAFAHTCNIWNFRLFTLVAEPEKGGNLPSDSFSLPFSKFLCGQAVARHTRVNLKGDMSPETLKFPFKHPGRFQHLDS